MVEITIDDLNVYDSQETVSIATDSQFREWISQFYETDEEIDAALERSRVVSVIDMINGVGDSWKYFTGQTETTIHERVEWIKSNADADNSDINIIEIVNEYLRECCPEYDFNHVEDE